MLGLLAGTAAAFHINADIAHAVIDYIDATGDEKFEHEAGVEILVETARLWRSLGHHDAEGRFRIDGATGPDEYSAIKDNNVFTNLMAQQNFSAAADAAEKYDDAAEALGVTTEEMASWRDAAAAMLIPYDERLGVHPQHEGFTQHAAWDFDRTPDQSYPLLLHYPYFDLYRKQVVKQADLVLAMHMRGDAFTAEQKARNFAYYEPMTVRDSSLSACTQAVVAAEVGQLDLAHAYLAEAALMDLRDVERNTRDGMHMASLAGAWIALVEGFGGMRAMRGTLSFSPRLPGGISRLRFRIRYRRCLVRVTVKGNEATYELLEGEPLELLHYGDRFTLTDKPSERNIPPITAGPRPPPTPRPRTHHPPLTASLPGPGGPASWPVHHGHDHRLRHGRSPTGPVTPGQSPGHWAGVSARCHRGQRGVPGGRPPGPAQPPGQSPGHWAGVTARCHRGQRGSGGRPRPGTAPRANTPNQPVS